MAQGNVDSTAFFDPLLRALDILGDSQFFYQAGGGRIEAATGKDAAVVNDLVSFTGTHAALQAKADLVSAICLNFGLEAAAHKLRCFHPNRLAPTHTFIHLAGRMPREVPLQHDGLMKHLGSAGT